jgi:hypothetical protein
MIETATMTTAPRTTDANEFATFELARLGYDIELGREVNPSTEDADDLLTLTLGDEVSPEVFAGLVWAAKNRPVDWALHLHPEQPLKQLRAAQELAAVSGVQNI